MSVMDMIEFGTSAARRSFNALAPAPPGIMGVPIAILLAKRKRLAWWRTEHASLRRATNRLLEAGLGAVIWGEDLNLSQIPCLYGGWRRPFLM